MIKNKRLDYAIIAGLLMQTALSVADTFFLPKKWTLGFVITARRLMVIVKSAKGIYLAIRKCVMVSANIVDNFLNFVYATTPLPRAFYPKTINFSLI